MLIIQQPGAAAFQWASLLPFLAATCYAVQQIATRKVTAGDAATTTLIFTTLAGTLVVSCIAPSSGRRRTGARRLRCWQWGRSAASGILR